MEKPILGMDQARAVLDAIFKAASAEPDRPLAVAIVDDGGDLVSYGRMDGCIKLAQRLALKKAYTISMMGKDGQQCKEFALSQGISILDYADANMTAAPSGVVIRRPTDDAIIGGIGISGRGPAENEELGRIGLIAIGL